MSAGMLAGQVALVTGASRGIGAACARELARMGAHVVLAARTQGALEEVDDAVRADGGSATLLPLDLADGESIDRVGPSLVARFGRLDVLVHAAGVLGRLTPVPHIQPRDWTAAMTVNASAAWRLIRTCAPVLEAAPAGRAVFLTDVVAREGRAFWGAYAAGKAAMEQLVLGWADECAHLERLRVNLFDPGVVATKLRRAAFPAEDTAGLARPEDVAPAVVALCLPGETRHGALVRRCAPSEEMAAAG